MTYLFLLLIALSVYFLLVSYVSKYSWYFVFIVWALIGMMYSTFLQIAITGNYASIGYLFNDLDRLIFAFMIKNRMGLFTIVRLYNISTAVYFLALSLFAMSFIGGMKEQRKFISFFFIAFPIIYAVFYDPEITYSIYCYIVNKNEMYYFLVCFVDLLLHIILYFCLSVPIIYLLLVHKKLYTYFKKKQLVGVAIVVGLADITYLFISYVSTLRTPYFRHSPMFLISIRPYGDMLRKEYSLYFTAAFIAILGMYFVSKKFNIIRQYGVIRRWILGSRTKNMNKSVINVFHTVKNVVYTFKIKLNEAQAAQGEQREQIMADLDEDIGKYVTNLTLMLDSDDAQADYLPEKCFLSDIVENALKQFESSDGITIFNDYLPNIEYVYSDAYYLADAFLSILQNAAEAIEAKDTKGTITIKITTEFEWVVVSFGDNGIGIGKKDLKHIFNRFYSTKAKISNWGIGLSSVYNIIKIHGGNIYVNSKKGVGTTVTVLLPTV